MVKNLLSKGNRKMGNKVYSFNLPPIKTCTPTKWCLGDKNNKPNCYALKGNFILPSVKRGQEERLQASKRKDFVDNMSKEISKFKPEYIRFHASGDFYSQEYVEKIIEITEKFPEILFRTTTRRRDLTNILQELNSLNNFVVRESLDKERINPVMDLPFAAIEGLEIINGKNSYKCVNHCPTCNYYCWENPVDVYFEKH